ncbi:MAG: hypothetical protein M5R41_10360 [Bacteroidia bacterium]|nr:hypothetical protein [Bacteroidia bacterium]
MKSRLFLFIVVCAIAVLAAIEAAAQQLPDISAIDLPALIGDWTQLVPVAIAFLAPMILGWLKRQLIIETTLSDGTIVKSLPKWFPKWAPYVAAPLLIWLADLCVQVLGGGPGVSPWILALLMPLPTWLRDGADQIRKIAGGVNQYVLNVPAAGGPIIYTDDPRLVERPQSPTETGDSTR